MLSVRSESPVCLQCPRRVPKVSLRCPYSVPTVCLQCPRSLPTMSPQCPGWVPTVSSQCPHKAPAVSPTVSPLCPTLSLPCPRSALPVSPTVSPPFPLQCQHRISTMFPLCPHSVLAVFPMPPHSVPTVSPLSPDNVARVPTMSPQSPCHVPTVAPQWPHHVPTVSLQCPHNVPALWTNQWFSLLDVLVNAGLKCSSCENIRRVDTNQHFRHKLVPAQVFGFFSPRITEYLGLEGTSGDHPVQAGSPKAGGFGMTLDTPRSPWEPVPMLCHPHGKFFLMLRCNSLFQFTKLLHRSFHQEQCPATQNLVIPDSHLNKVLCPSRVSCKS